MLVRIQNNRFSNIFFYLYLLFLYSTISCLILSSEHAVGCQKDPASSADAQPCSREGVIPRHGGQWLQGMDVSCRAAFRNDG